MSTTIDKILLKMRLIRELAGKEFTSTEHMEFEALAKIEDITGDKAHPHGFYAEREFNLIVFEAISAGMIFRIYYSAEGYRIKIVWVDIAN